jgi:hypothetical protein
MLKTMLAHAGSSLCLALMLIVVMQSCKKSDVREETVTPAQIEELRAFIANTTGLQENLVTYSANTKTFHVANDGLISLSDAQARLKAEPTTGAKSTEGTQQRSYAYLVTRTNAATITIYADATVPADWSTALDQAINNWNSTNSLVFFKRVYNSTTTTTTGGNGRGKKNNGGTTTTTVTPAYNVLVTTLYDATTNMIAQAYYPDYNGNAGKEVDINTYYNTLSASYKTFAITHEMGHIIGFTHTDGTYGNLIPGTPETDPNSVMNSFVLPWNGFTPYDVLAATTVYPK